MRKRIDEVAREAGKVHDIDAFWALIHGQLEVRGAQSALFGVLATKRELEVRRLTQALIWKSSHKAEYFEAFKDDNLFENDRTADYCVTQSGIMLWHDPANWQSATPSEKRRAGIERDLGLAIGFTVPSAHFHAGQVGGVGVAMPDVPLGEFDRFWKQEGRELIALCGLLDAGIRGQHMDELVGLSRQERECLNWLAAGMRPGRIAERMHISKKTVDSYLKRAHLKLRATTRDQMVAKALMLGVINP